MWLTVTLKYYFYTTKLPCRLPCVYNYYFFKNIIKLQLAKIRISSWPPPKRTQTVGVRLVDPSTGLRLGVKK